MKCLEVIEMFNYGSEVLRFDCHLHTKEDKEFKYSGDVNWYIANYVDKLKEEDIRVGVITNHNKFVLKEYKDISKHAFKSDIFLLPGVEVSIKEGQNGVHGLIIFKPEDWISNGQDYINQFLDTAFRGITDNREHENTKCKFDLNGLLEELETYGKDYFVIFAHVDQSSGLFKECKGGVISTLSKNPTFKKRILGLQKSANNNNYSNSVEWIGYQIAKLEGSDPKSIDEIGKGSKSYIKIGEFSFEALKYSLLDHNNRVFCEYPQYRHGHIKSISFEGGIFSGESINFSRELNCLIGIRGSGKSALLEAIRYSLNREALEDKNYKDSLIKYALGSGGVVSLNICDKHNNEYILKRILGEREFILDQNGKDVQISISSLINNPLYFGQKDLSMTKNGYEFELLDKLLGDKTNDYSRKMEENHKELCGAIKKFHELEKLPERISDLEVENNDAERLLNIFKDKGIEEKLVKMTEFQNDDTHIVHAIDAMDEYLVEYSLDKLQALISKNKVFIQYESKYNKDLFNEIFEFVNEFNSELGKVQISMLNLETLRKNVKNKQDKLTEVKEGLRDEFAEIKREIQSDDLNADIYLQKKNLIDNNKKEIEKLKKKMGKKETLISEISKLFRERNEILLSEFEIYRDEIAKINQIQNEIAIDIEFKGNRDLFVEALKDKLKGSGISKTKYTRIATEFTDFSAIISDCLLSKGQRLQSLLTETEYAKTIDLLKTDYEELLLIKTPNEVMINYHGKPLSQHSAGQRASALVLFILSQHENDIIIIDQPEDDLDNQVIYREIIKSIKVKKPGMQFIFATHNANIPVLGDAENIIQMKEIDSKFNIINGTIDNPQIQNSIVDIMEGGTEAFKRRNGIYEIWTCQI